MRSDGTWTYTWEHGRQLASMSKGSDTWTYEYNADGMRTKRTNGEDVYTYVYNGTQLIRMTYDGYYNRYTMDFTYDADGTPLSVYFDEDYYEFDQVYDEELGEYVEERTPYPCCNSTYYYMTDPRGDVVALVSSAGGYAVTYEYDAWGRLIDTDSFECVADFNPLRYRGYVYDIETGLYYLQSRYYNPEIGRFINADTAIGQIGNIQGTNMFAYAFNNPVMYSDPTGNWPKLSTFFAAVAVVAVAVAATAAVIVSCGAAAPLVAAVTGTVVSSASAATAVTAVGLTACSVAVAATVTSAAAFAAEITAEKHHNETTQCMF